MEVDTPGDVSLHSSPKQPPPVYFTRKGRRCKPTEKMEGFIDVQKKKKIQQVPYLPLPVVASETAHFNKPQPTNPDFSSLKSKKTFHCDGPTVLPTSPFAALDQDQDDLFKKLNVQLQDHDDVGQPFSGTSPVDHFEPGLVKYSTKNALREMVYRLETLHGGDHGCIIDENYQPVADVYNKNCHFIVSDLLGKGSNGKAQLCYDSNSEQSFVRKKILKNKLRNSEVLIPINLDHENVTKFYGLIQKKGKTGELKAELMLEYGGMALNRFLLDGCNSLNESEIWELAGQGLAGLEHIALFGIIHLDIKPENLCITKTERGLRMKITDFGSGKLPQEAITFSGWTPEYMAPESCKLVLQSLHNIKFDVTAEEICGKVDVFAFALVVMYMYKEYHILQKLGTNGKTSYKGFSTAERNAMQTQLMLWLASNENLVHNLIPDECELDMRELLAQMTQHEVDVRFDAHEALTVVNKKIRDQQMIKGFIKATTNQLESKSTPEFRQPTIYPQENFIPDIAVAQLDMETGPIRNLTKDKLRKKIGGGRPYGKDGKSMAAGKKSVPQTPIEEMEKLSLAHPPSPVPVAQKTEMAYQVVAQPTEEAHETYDYNQLRNTPNLADPVHLSGSPNQFGVQPSSGPVGGFERRRLDKTSNVPMLNCEPVAPMAMEEDVPKMPKIMVVNKSTLNMDAGYNNVGQVNRPVTEAQIPEEKKCILQQLAALINARAINLNFGNTNMGVQQQQQQQQDVWTSQSYDQQQQQQEVRANIVYQPAMARGIVKSSVVVDKPWEEASGNLPNFGFLD